VSFFDFNFLRLFWRHPIAFQLVPEAVNESWHVFYNLRNGCHDLVMISLSLTPASVCGTIRAASAKSRFSGKEVHDSLGRNAQSPGPNESDRRAK